MKNSFFLFLILSLLAHNSSAMYTNEDREALFNAIAMGDADKVRKILDNEGGELICFSYEDSSGNTPLMAAVESNKPEIVKIIIKKEECTKDQTQRQTGKTARQIAEEKGYHDIVDILTTKEPDKGPTLELFKAIETNDITTIKNLFADAREKIIIPLTNDQGDTLLTAAVKKGDKNVIEFFLNPNFDLLNKRTASGDTAIILAIVSENLPILQLLLNYCVDDKTIDQKDGMDGNTPLMVAITTENLAIISAVVEQVPDPEQRNSLLETASNLAQKAKTNKAQIIGLTHKAEKQYQLLKAIASNDLEKIKELTIDRSLLNSKSFIRNPLNAAIHTFNIEIVKALVIQGADVNLALNANLTALFCALQKLEDVYVGKKAVEILRYLLENKANPNIRADIFELTPLWMAIEPYDSDAIALLIQYGADINATLSDPEEIEKFKMEIPCHNATPLMVAALHGKAGLVEQLLHAKADPSLKNVEGQTALDLLQEQQKKHPDDERLKTIHTLLEEALKKKPQKPQPSTPIFNITTSLSTLEQALKTLAKRLR